MYTHKFISHRLVRRDPDHATGEGYHFAQAQPADVVTQWLGPLLGSVSQPAK